jgi:hypothetical protein
MVARVAAAAILALGASMFVSAQTPARPASRPGTAAPRAADGKPDLTGVWQVGSSRRGSWEEANSGLGLGGTGLDPQAPPNLPSTALVREPPPYQPWAAKKVLEYYNRRGIDDPTGLCLPPGLPRVNLVTIFPIQIIQTPTQIAFLYEYMNTFRVVPLNAKHPDDIVPGYFGDSVGRWEGDTLVVDVIGFNDKTWLTGTGTFHSEDLHVVERYTRVSKDRIDYEATLEDPKVLTRPWTIRTTMMLREGTRVAEYVCAENNQVPAQYEKLLKEGTNFRR